jgi:hypothetical protein
MNTTSLPAWLFGAALAAAAGLVSFACRAETPSEGPPEAKRTRIADNVFFEVQGDDRRVVVSSRVVLREGQLEGLLCRKNTKEHEYILAADVDAVKIHAALLAAGAKPGSPVQFQPKFSPACGTPIKIRLQYVKDGKTIVVPASDWVRDVKTKKDLDSDWVFAGSHLIPDPDDPKKPPFYLANSGDLVCVCNMDDAMLDLPIPSPHALAERAYQANTDRIPPVDTAVDVIFDVVRDKKDKEKDK